METRLLASLGRIAGLGGIALGVVAIIFRDFLKQNLLPKAGLESAQASHLLLAFLIIVFGIASTGIVAWIIGQTHRGQREAPMGSLLLLVFLAIVVVCAAAKVGISDDEKQSKTSTHDYTDQIVDGDKLPPSVTSQPVQQQSILPLPFFLLFDEKADLAAKDSLNFDHSDLIVGPVGARKLINIAVNTLTLRNGARVITNGNTLAIRALHVFIYSGSFISFDVKNAVAVPSNSPGASGTTGEAGGKLILTVFEPLTSTLKIDLYGQKGGKGGPGNAGRPIPPAANGDAAADTLMGCGHGGGNGTAGRKGNPGEPGAPGGAGGDGGTLIFSGPASNAVAIDFLARGGEGGDGGDGGPGGPGQQGGKGGAGSHFCSGGNDGPNGDAGDSGSQGPRGRPGVDGKEKIIH